MALFAQNDFILFTFLILIILEQYFTFEQVVLHGYTALYKCLHYYLILLLISEYDPIEAFDHCCFCWPFQTILYVAALIADGSHMIANTKAAIVRLGFIEIVNFTQHFFPRNTRLLCVSCFWGSSFVLSF